MKHAIILIFVVAIGSAHCDDRPEKSERTDGFTPVLNSKEDSLYHDVMEGHDIGMAKMGTLKKQLNRVSHELDSINKLPEKNIDQLRTQNLKLRTQNLEPKT